VSFSAAATSAADGVGVVVVLNVMVLVTTGVVAGRDTEDPDDEDFVDELDDELLNVIVFVGVLAGVLFNVNDTIICCLFLFFVALLECPYLSVPLLSLLDSAILYHPSKSLDLT